MTARRLATVLSLAVLTAATAPAGARAGGAARGVTRVEVGSRGAIVLTVSTGGDALRRLRLALIETVQSYRAGRGCVTRATDHDIAELAAAERLGRSMRAIRRHDGTFYVGRRGRRRLRIGRSFNAAVLDLGLARTAVHGGRVASALSAAQARARRSHRGIWSHCARPPRHTGHRRAQRLAHALLAPIKRVIVLLARALWHASSAGASPRPDR